MRLPEESLYDLIFDPNETNNLVADQASGTVLAEMRDRLDRWMLRTSDPLLNGPVPAPHGAEINNPNGISPKETPDRSVHGVWSESFDDGDVDYRAVAKFLQGIGYQGLIAVELAYENGTNPTRPLEEDLRISREYAKNIFLGG